MVMLNTSYISHLKGYLCKLRMKEEFNDIKFEEVPVEFYSDSNKALFQTCTFCSKDLSLGDETYMIEKSFKINPNNGQKNTVFEYAICMSCNIKKMQAMSEESIRNIQNYMQENFVFEQMEKQLGNHNRLEECVVTGEKIGDLEEYNIVGQFVGDKMIVGQFPLLFSPSIGEEIQELLSQKTKDEFDDFMNTINDVPPELKELFKTKRPVLV